MRRNDPNLGQKYAKGPRTEAAGPRPLACGNPQTYEEINELKQSRELRKPYPPETTALFRTKEKSSDSENRDRDRRSPRHRCRDGHKAGLRRHGRGGPRPQRARLREDSKGDRERRRARARGRRRRQQDRSGERRSRAGGRRARRADGAGEQRRDNARRSAVQDDRRGLGRGDQRQPARCVPDDQGGAEVHDRAEMGSDRQRLVIVGARQPRPGQLLRHERPAWRASPRRSPRNWASSGSPRTRSRRTSSPPT